MPESRPDRLRFGAASAAAVVLTLLAGPAPWGALGALLAQPLHLLAQRGWRGSRVDWRRDAPAACALFALAAGGALLLAAGPLAELQRRGSLAGALGLSATFALLLLALWRSWPLWQAQAGAGGALRAQWARLRELDVTPWRGLLAALLVALPLAAIVALAWPGLLAGAARWAVTALLALLPPVLYAGLARIVPARERPRAWPVFAAPEAAPEAPVADAPLEPQLYQAARSGRVDRALELLELGADPHAPPPRDERDQRGLVALAAVLPDLRLLRALIARGVDLNRTEAGLTPLLAATRDSWHGRPEAVMTLLANGADPRAVDGDGNTPLHHAARSTDPGVAALLLDAAAELDALNQDGFTPLGIACASGNWRLARFLLERGARPEPRDGQPALLAAAGGEEDDAAGVQLLLKHKAKVDARGRHGRTAVHEAAYAGHVEIVEALLAAGADPALRDDAGRNALLDAARGGHLAVIETLLATARDGEALLLAHDADGRDALMLAALAERATPALLHRLVELGLDPQRRDGEERRALDRAAEAGRWSLVAALDRDYGLPASVSGEFDELPPPDRAPIAVLRDALLDGRFAGLERLLPLLAPGELDALLHEAEILAAPDAIVWLLRHGADLDVRDPHGDTPLFVLLDRGPAALAEIELLLARGASPAGRGGLARFLAACLRVHGLGDARALQRCAFALLDRGADPFAPSAGGDPPLTLAIRLDWQPLALRLIALGVALDVRDSRGMSALHLAAALGREALVKALIAHGANPDTRAADGQTPLGVALASGRRDIADWLDWRGWPLPRRPLRASDLPAAAMHGDADALRRLLALGLPVDATDAQGCTALLRAAGGGHRDVVELLLARDADLTLAAHSGATPLSAAVSMRHLDVVERLLRAGAPLEQRLPGELTALMVASALGLTDVAARLLAAGADVHAEDAQGRSALHCAAMYGFGARDRARLVALLDTLLLAGAEPDRPAAGATPLLLLLGARAEPGSAADEDVLIAGIELLLDQEVRLDAQDPRGFGPLHLAALHGLLRVVQRLLRAGADPNLRDTLNRTPRDIATMRGFVDIAAEFVPASPDSQLSMARFLRDPR
ncbi:MAG TPA: ankyrin repeat domain-containing protein [Lysobacter sp.]|nr:ankyrin repeat domain-containing protein [Lysobacter sp.]